MAVAEGLGIDRSQVRVRVELPDAETLNLSGCLYFLSPKERKAIPPEVQVNFCATFISRIRLAGFPPCVLAGGAIPGPPGKSTKS